jgi:deazaflavin-dependent oxidoreductase (nitroreductase family)
MKIPDVIWRWMRSLNRRVAGAYGKAGPPSSLVLVLTTTCRKSGLPRQTPLQYEEMEGEYYVGSARGPQADWYRNILANPQVEVQVGQEHFKGEARAITDVKEVADFLQYRLERRPRMIGAIMRAEGLPRKHTRVELEKFAAEKAVVAIRADRSPEGEYSAKTKNREENT